MPHKNSSNFNKISKAPHVGFTLMELLIVIAIIGSITALVLPNFSIPNDNEQRDLLKIQNFIEKWRNKIITIGEPMRLEISPHDNSLKIYKIFTDTKEKASKINHIAELNISLAGYDLQTSNNNISGKNVTVMLYPDGTTDPFIFRQNSAENKRNLTLNYSGTAANGRISLESVK